MPLPDSTVDDLVAELRLSDKPNIIVEGKEDAFIYGELVRHLGIFKIDFFAAGSRTTLLALYDRLSLYENTGDFRHQPVVFIADRDAWIFNGGIPRCYSDIIWTNGYSVENDLYIHARPSLETLMDTCEAAEHKKVLDTIAEWFAFEVEEFLAGRPPSFKHHCNEVVPLGKTRMDPGFCRRRRFRPPNARVYRQVRNGYQSQLRGKLLFQMLARYLSASNRKAKYSIPTLREIALKMTPSHPLINRLIREVKGKLP